MLDYRVYTIYGWKIEDSEKISEVLDMINSMDYEYYRIEKVYVEDTMCEEYIYLGAILFSFDPTEDNKGVIIDNNLINNSTSEWNSFIKDFPSFKKFLNGEPKLYVFNKIW